MWGRPSTTPGDSSLVVTPTTPNGSPAATSPPDGPRGGVAFTMRIPAIGYAATVREGITANDLENGPGHYPRTAWPGRAGTVGIAAHNVYWLAFVRLQPGDLVEIQTARSLFEYQITGTRITGPDDRSVLTSSYQHRLALTTCYPLWAGALATRRFVVFGREIDGRSGGAAG